MGKVDEIRARWAAATPGPWTHCVWYGTDDGGWAAIGPHHEEDDGISDEPGCDAEQCAERDAEAIAAAPSDVAFLLAELGALRERAERGEQARGCAISAANRLRESLDECAKKIVALEKARAAAERVVETFTGDGWSAEAAGILDARIAALRSALDAARGEVGE
jgi:hypothetical protein